MPERSFMPIIVRTSEVDSIGNVLPGTYLRWFQEAAIRASAANGFDDERYRELGSSWFVKELHLQILRSIEAQEELTVATWIADMQRITSRRQYRLTRDNGEAVANGEAHWVYVNRETGRPRRLDKELLDGFSPLGIYSLSDPDWGMNALDEMCSPVGDVHEMSHTVRWTEIDEAHHVNNTVYADWMTDHLALANVDGGPGIIKRLRIRYEASAQEGMSVDLQLWRTREHMWLHRTSVNDGEESSEGRTLTKAVLEVA